MIESLGVGRRAVIASAVGALLCSGLCSFGGQPGAAPGGTAAKAGATPQWDVSPDGEWLALSFVDDAHADYRGWLVRLEDGDARPLAHVGRVDPQLAFDGAGRLRVTTQDSAYGGASLVWLDPTRSEVLESTRERERMKRELEPLEFGWARTQSRRVGEREALRRVEWPEHKARFELDSRRDVEIAIGAQPGVVYRSERVGDQLRLVRRELRSGAESELVAAGRGLERWTLSNDGRAIALLERSLESRIRVIDAGSGALLAGPWLGADVEWAPGGGSRHLVVTQGQRRLLLDTLLDDTRPEGEWARYEVLLHGEVVAQEAQQVVLLDRTLERSRVLFELPPSHSTAARAR